MGDQQDAPAINEVIFFLIEYDSSAAADLASRGPDYQEAMEPGIVGGRPKRSEEVARRALKIRADILAVALSSAAEKSERQIAGIDRRL